MRLSALLAAAIVAAGSLTSLASAAPTPPPGAIDLTKVQPKQLLPKTKLRSAFVVEVNKLGQVTRVRRAMPSKNPTYDAQTYGNALQAFIRTPDGHAIAGVYELSYSYDPATARVLREVKLLHPGGVNANAQGAALQMMAIAKKNRGRTPPPGLAQTPAPAPSVNVKRMPDLPQVMNSPSPAPH